MAREYYTDYSDQRNAGPEVASMDPYTTQITNRLSEAEKYLAEVSNQLARIADKLVGPVPEEAIIEKNLKAPPTAMMEHILGQTNALSRKIVRLGDVVNRLQSL